MTRRWASRLAVTGLGLVVVGGCFAISDAAAGWAQSPGQSICSQYATYTALGEADGVQTITAAPGATLTDTVDGDLPGAQAEVNSLLGSSGWAGAPYSSVVAGNVGNANVNPNQLPVFAVSSYPSEPTAHNSTPLGDLQASSPNTLSSSASVTSGGPSSGQATVGHISVSATASCGADGTLQAVAKSTTDAFDVAGVLRIGAVTSDAAAAMTSSGEPTLEGSITTAGATVLGQHVDITDQGLVVAGSGVPVPSNPLEQALSSAGITVQYLALSKDPKTGSVTAPGIEVTWTQHVQGVGQGVVTTTYVLGRAIATAIESGGASAVPASTPGVGQANAAPTPAASVTTRGSSNPPPGASSSIGPAASNPAAAATGGSTESDGSPAPALSGPGQSPNPVSGRSPAPVSYILNSSAASFYAVVAIAGGLLLAAALLFGMLGVKLRWR